jgi:predicted nucleic acid-binding protein
MKVVVEDANVLLDLVNGGVLALWLGAGFENCTTYLVWQEIIVTAQKEHIQSFIEAELLQLEDVPPEWWREAAELSMKLGISIPDSSVWILAREKRAILLTGDSKLRRNAQAEGIEVRGILWVLDHLVDTGRLKPEIAANSLAQMISGGAFLPVDECAKRIRMWSGSD